MYICNPAICKCVKLLNCEFPKDRNAFVMHGFGFDTINGEFKVVVILLWVSDHALQSKAQVYTLGSNSWRTVSNAPKMLFLQGCSAFVNGSLHWLTRDDQVEDGSMIIVSFNLSSEEFGVIPCPKFNCITIMRSFTSESSTQLVELGGCLSVVEASFGNHIEIWIMKEYNVKESWTRFSVSKSYLVRMKSKRVKAVSFRKNSEIILLCDSSTLVSYNTETGNFTTLEVDGLNNNLADFPKYVGHAFSYAESLILPKSA
ncbi:F-box protein [Thalictrum thalictroides]|uniref:F-box protein n=1 Tax=Thalictrum thalictroides TaxID=46969 RepID=A0A7J6X6P5_THATH|nr:F-box protein [Thalictrum thalictroides]